MNTLDKLLKVQTQLKAPRSQFNKFGKYYYRNCEDILEAAKPLCEEVRAVITVTDELVQIGGRYYIKALARFWDCERDGVIESSAFAREEEDKKGMDLSQVTGSTSSYARKYALNGLLAIDDTKDSDATNKSKEDATKAGKAESIPPNKQNQSSQAKSNSTPQTQSGSKEDTSTKRVTPETRITDVMIKSIKAELSRTQIPEPTILKMFKLAKLDEMTIQQYKSCMKKLEITPTKEDEQEGKDE